MATKQPTAPPPLDKLPASPLDDALVHQIINAKVSGKSQKDIASKLSLPPAYVRGVIQNYLSE